MVLRLLQSQVFRVPLAHRVFQGLLVYRKLLEFLVLRKLLVLPALRKRRARSIRLFVNLLVTCGEYKTPAFVLAGVLLQESLR